MTDMMGTMVVKKIVSIPGNRKKYFALEFLTNFLRLIVGNLIVMRREAKKLLLS